MANICDNTFYSYTEDEDNYKYIKKYLETVLKADLYEQDGTTIEATFESRWTFPENQMKELYDKVPNKEDVYMRCLSVEYGCFYHALWVCDEDGWTEK